MTETTTYRCPWVGKVQIDAPKAPVPPETTDPTAPDPADKAWKRQYVAEFIRYAASRGWSGQDASEWAAEIMDEALRHGGTDPEAQARADVIECEREAASAP